MQAKIRKEEDNVVKSLIKKVVKKSVELRKIGTFLDSLDVTSSFAVLASEKDFVCPVVDKSTDLEIVDGRHLVVEDSMKAQMKSFSSNDLFLNKESSSWVITGPNMGGKSTFLRQSAIITILAQCGSYVPAKSARIGIVDKIFSRVYSADDLSNNLSTFMVEMVETSYILNGATDRSLALLDEVGRGTSAKEGLALAFATLKHLGTVNKSRNLFSTHFGHEIDHLVKRHIDQSGLFKFKKTTVSKEGNQLYFNRHLVDGVSEQSYAIEVAEKAGFPAEALKFARAAMEDDGS
jgi:DNA mismatch repair ATPase MutS